MSIKNIVNLSGLGGILLLTVIAGAIVNPMVFCATAGAAMFIPEALSEVE